MSMQASWRVLRYQVAVTFLLGGAWALSCSGPKTPCEQAAAHLSECTGSPIDVPASATDEQCLAVAETSCMDRAIMDLVGGAVGDVLCSKFGIDCKGHCDGTPDPCESFNHQDPCWAHKGCEVNSRELDGYEGIDAIDTRPTWYRKFLSCYGQPVGCREGGFSDPEQCQRHKGCTWRPTPEDERCTTAAGDSTACPVDTNGTSTGSGTKDTPYVGPDSRGYCGDKSCRAEEKEDCTSCVADCGYCPACGDGSCNYFPAPGETIENCSNCPQDCGQCPVCGDGSCWENMGTDSETCASCPQDCCSSGSNGSNGDS